LTSNRKSKSVEDIVVQRIAPENVSGLERDLLDEIGLDRLVHAKFHPIDAAGVGPKTANFYEIWE